MIGEHKTILIQFFVSFYSIITKKNVSIVIKDRGKTWRIKNRVVSLQLLSYNHEETDCRIAPRTKLQSNGGVVIVEKDVDISMFLVYSYSICASVMRGKMRQ